MLACKYARAVCVGIVQCFEKISKMTCVLDDCRKRKGAINGRRNRKGKSEIQVDKRESRKQSTNVELWADDAGWQLIQLVLVLVLVLVRSDHWHVKAITQWPVPPAHHRSSISPPAHLCHTCSCRNAQYSRRTGVFQGEPLNHRLSMGSSTVYFRSRCAFI